MAIILNTNIDVTKIPKEKLHEGKKGKYLPVTIVINDEVDKFGNHGPVTVGQSKEEREAKEAKVYLGNVSVVWTNGVCPEVPPKDGQAKAVTPKAPAANITEPEDDDLPF